jgi:hypothetical protein
MVLVEPLFQSIHIIRHRGGRKHQKSNEVAHGNP